MEPIKYLLSVDSDFLIGTGSGSIAADDLTQQDPEGKPIVPGNTIKGLIKWEFEAICDFFNIDVCDSTLKKDSKLCGVNRDLDMLCPVCAVFGSTRFPSPFHFSTLRLNSEEPDSGKCVRRRAFNSIVPKTGTVDEGKLFMFKMAKQASFTGEITQYRPFPSELDLQFDVDQLKILLKLSMGMVRAVGSRKSRGQGNCRIELIEAQWPSVEQIKEVKG